MKKKDPFTIKKKSKNEKKKKNLKKQTKDKDKKESERKAMNLFLGLFLRMKELFDKIKMVH